MDLDSALIFTYLVLSRKLLDLARNRQENMIL